MKKAMNNPQAILLGMLIAGAAMIAGFALMMGVTTIMGW
jgi:amino acid transporter